VIWVYRVEFLREYILIWVGIFSTNLRYMSYMQVDQIYKDSTSNSFALLYFTFKSFERIGGVFPTKISVPFFSKH
jgi:hypothetical protein